MKMISNQVSTMCIFLAVNCCTIAWTPSDPSVMPSSFIKMSNQDLEQKLRSAFDDKNSNIDKSELPTQKNARDAVVDTAVETIAKFATSGFRTPAQKHLPDSKVYVKFYDSLCESLGLRKVMHPSSGSNHIMEEMVTSLNKLYEERNEAFKQKFGINIKDQPYIEEQVITKKDVDASYCETQQIMTEVPQKSKSVSQNMDEDMMEPQKQAKDIKVREVHEPLFCSGKELTPGAWELIRQSREIYAGRGMIQDSYKQYNSQLAEELRMNHHFSNFTVEKSTGEKRKMAELSLKDFD